MILRTRSYYLNYTFNQKHVFSLSTTLYHQRLIIFEVLLPGIPLGI